MSELSSQCGCRETRCEKSCGCGNIIWIILLFSLFNNDCDSCGGSFLKGGSNNCCECILLLLVLSSCCGSNSFF